MARNNPSRQQIVAKAQKATAAHPRVSAGTPARPGMKVNSGRPVPPKPGAGGGASGGPAAAAGPAAGGAPSVTPWDSRYEQRMGAAGRRYLSRTGDFDLDEATAKQDFGLDDGFNDYKVNPNSRAALLEDSFQSSQRGVTNTAGLDLYSGGTGNRLAANRESFSQNRDALEKLYRDTLGSIGGERTKASEDRGNEEDEAAWDRANEASDAPLDPDTAPAKGGTRKAAPKTTRRRQTQQAVARARVAPPAPRRRR